jgi:hypothetical protein
LTPCQLALRPALSKPHLDLLDVFACRFNGRKSAGLGQDLCAPIENLIGFGLRKAGDLLMMRE